MSGSAAAVEPCPLCGGDDRPLAVTGYDRQWTRAGVYRYRRCRGCGLLAQSPLPDAARLPAFYPDEYPTRIAERTANLDKAVNRLAIACFYGTHSVARPAWLRAGFRAVSGRLLRDALEPHGGNRLLEVGCGAGGLLALHRQLGWDVVGIEPHAAAVTAARARGLTVHEGTLADAPQWPPFDVMLLSHVLEHVTDPLALLRQTAARLTPDGKIVVVTPNARALGLAWFGSAWYALDAPRHVMLFDAGSLVRLAVAAGLRIGRMTTRGDRSVLCASRHYRHTQGAELPDEPAARSAAVARAWNTPRRDRLFRIAAGAATDIAALLGRGEVLIAELYASAEETMPAP